MRIALLIQARSQSTRLPDKIYATINGKSILRRVVDSAHAAAHALAATGDHDVVVAVIGPENDDKLRGYCGAQLDGVPFVGGSENDLIDRYKKAADHYSAEIIARITSDCVMIPSEVIAQCVIEAVTRKADYCSNTIIRTFVEGFDIQVVSKMALDWFDSVQRDKREHPFCDFDENATIRDRFIECGMSIHHFLNASNPALIKTSIDTEQDLQRITEVITKIERKHDKS